MENTQKEWESRESGRMANLILDHMRERSLTMEVLDKTYDLVARIFHTDATLKKADISQP